MAAAVAINRSETLRKEGNQFYSQAKASGLAPIVKKSKLEKAIACYNGALREGINMDQKASASKNIARASWEMTILIEKKVSSFQLLVYYFKETMSSFESAIHLGLQSKPNSWIDDLKSSQEEYLVAVLEFISVLPYDCRIGLMDTFGRSMESKALKVSCYTEMGQVLFHKAVNAMEATDFKRSLHCLKECYRPIEEMKRHGAGDPHAMSEARVLDDDVILHTASAESMQAVVTGDELLCAAVMDSEELKMSLVFEVLDWYTKAVVLARDIEIEREAIASCRIGKVYDQVLKMPHKAKKYFMHSVTLAHSLAPRDFVMHDWFRLARDTLEKYQSESVVEQQKREDEERDKHLKDMQAEVKQLNGFRDQYRDDQSKHYLLLVNVYKAFPPKKKANKLQNTEAQLKKMDMAALKKVFQKACIHYHPDKQEAKEGKAWKYFSAEITKTFTNIYERYKCC